MVGPDKKIKLMLTYPMSTGRNFDEVLRVLDSMQLTAKHKVATPVNWKKGEDVIICRRCPTKKRRRSTARLEIAEAVYAHRSSTEVRRKLSRRKGPEFAQVADSWFFLALSRLRRKDDLCILVSDEHLSADEYDVRLLSVLRRHVFWRGGLTV